MRTMLTRRTWMSSAAAVLGTAAFAGEESLNSRWRPNYIPLVSTLRNYHTTRNLA
jgi:hypothetical protein